MLSVVHRRVGGLEVATRWERRFYIVHRRVGGLELPREGILTIYPVHRRVGGLEGLSSYRGKT